MNRASVELDSQDYPASCYLLVGGKAYETVCENAERVREFVRERAGDAPVQVLNLGRSRTDRQH